MQGEGLLAAGMSFRTAPLEVRERLALDDEGVCRHLARLRDEGICREAMLLSTCNRVELYAVPAPGGEDEVRRYLKGMHGLRDLERYLYWRQGREAVLHLFRVAASLDSLVVGEPQILGQVKEAVRLAEASGCLGRRLGRLARQSLSVAKRVRSETDIGRFRVGVGNAGVDLARQIFGELEGHRAMLLGVGEMGRQVGRALLGAGLDELVVANRTYERAVEVASLHAGTAITMERVEEYLSRVDIVITAAATPHPIVGSDAVRRALKARRYRPLFLIDLAVPRNIDPAVAELDEAYLFNVDDLTQVVERGREARAAASDAAQRLVEGEADRFLLSLKEIEASPAIGRLTRHVESLRLSEIDRSRRLLGALDPVQAAQLDAMTRALTKKILDGPLKAIREAARSGDHDRLQALIEAFHEPPEEDA